MNEKDLEEKIVEVIKLLEKEINIRNKGKGVYKKILNTYRNSLEACREGALEKISIRGGVRYFYDSMADYNEELLSKMDEAEKIITTLRDA